MSSTIHPHHKGKSVYATTSPYEARIGYYRAVRHATHIYVSGTTAVDPASSSSSAAAAAASAPQIMYPGDARRQTRVALEECLRAVVALGGTGRESVVRVRMFVANRRDCEAVGAGFAEVFGKHVHADAAVAATMVVVAGFVAEEMLVEVEVDAVVDEERDDEEK